MARRRETKKSDKAVVDFQDHCMSTVLYFRLPDIQVTSEKKSLRSNERESGKVEMKRPL